MGLYGTPLHFLTMSSSIYLDIRGDVAVQINVPADTSTRTLSITLTLKHNVEQVDITQAPSSSYAERALLVRSAIPDSDAMTGAYPMYHTHKRLVPTLSSAPAEHQRAFGHSAGLHTELQTDTPISMHQTNPAKPSPLQIQPVGPDTQSPSRSLSVSPRLSQSARTFDSKLQIIFLY